MHKGVENRVWRSGMQFLLTPDGQVWEKLHGNCYVWDSYRGVFGRDASSPPIRWVDLVKDRAPVVSVSLVEAMMILLIRWVGEVESNASSELAEHKADNDHYTPERG